MDGDALNEALRAALEYHDQLPSAPVGARATYSELRMALANPLPETGMPAREVIRELNRDAGRGLHASSGSRFFAWVTGGALPSAVAADWLTSAWDQNAGMYAMSPAAAVAEEVAGEWLKELFGLPRHASFAFVSGCQMAHVTCLMVARHALCPGVARSGLFGSTPLRVLASSPHGTVGRALRILGIGEDRIEPIERIEAIDAPALVILQAGNVNTGDFDDFRRLIPLAKARGCWVHVDGAFGLWAGASPRFGHLLNGVEQADSWAADGHKWLNVPYESGYAFVADAARHKEAFAVAAPYLTFGEGGRDEMDWNPESSRRARAFPTYAAIRELGREGIAEVVERCCRLACVLTRGIGALPGAEVLWEPIINQGLVSFGDRTDDVIAAINASGVAYFSGTTWNGRRAMRISVCNWQTTDADVKRVIEGVAEVLSSVARP